MPNPIFDSLRSRQQPSQSKQGNPMVSVLRAAMTGDTKPLFDQMRGNPSLNGREPEEVFQEFLGEMRGKTVEEAYRSKGLDANAAAQNIRNLGV